jgi:hypothetical protein
MHIRFIRTLSSALLFGLVVLSMSVPSFAQIGVAIRIGPPALPVYEQPLCPGDGYLWTPGYWGYDYDVTDYYWVPGTWVTAPEVGFLWTPAYWGWGGDGFVFYDGYWGANVGFYGGINYGFGYFGSGFEGGRWDGGHFFYNRSVTNVNVTNIHNVYDTHVTYNNESHVSYNGGNGGINARPTAGEEAAARERHIPPIAAQTQHAQAARANPQQRASVNMGRPGVAATPRPGDFNDRGAAPTKEAGDSRGGTQGRSENSAAPLDAAVHPRDLPPVARSTPNTGNAKRDRKYQQQQDKQATKQQQERDQLQQKQDEEHVKMDKQKANDTQRQQVEQVHQQQTQQLQQRHQQAQQQLQEKQQPASREQGKK